MTTTSTDSANIVVKYTVQKYTISKEPLIVRGLLFVDMANGDRLEVTSPHGIGEPRNSGPFNYQKDCAVEGARETGATLAILDLDLVEKYRSERTRV